jgi:hypothetical protein
MRFSKSLILALAFVGTLAFAAVPSPAQAPGTNSPILRALSDVRLMRAYLDKLTPNEVIDAETQQAIDEIDAAIREMKEAAIDDGKDLRDHAPIDASLTPSGRFHKAREAGTAAYLDLSHGTDTEAAREHKVRAQEHIQKANHIIDHIILRFNK